LSSLPPDSDDEKTTSAPAHPYSDLDPLVLQRRRYIAAVAIAASVLLLVSVVAAFFLNRPGKITSQQLIDIVEKNIASQISSSADLQFDGVHVARKEEGYEITGSVDAVAPGGETGRFRFSCLVRKQGDGTWVPGKWEVARLR
jgi:hypothetical protein